MDIEIRTTAGTWILNVDERELGETEPGQVAAQVRAQIQSGAPVAAKLEGAEATPRSIPYVMFNPAHVVAVVEHARRRRVGVSRQPSVGA